MTTPFVTTGVPTTPGPNGSVPVRREIRDLQQNNPLQWNLFLLGLRALQTIDESEQLSFYQISGIHGLPYIPWNGVEGLDGQQTGYCTHSSILFLPWHRPYLALLEQLLYEQIQTIAAQFPPELQSQYVNAAKDFRLPYWDWGLQPAARKNSFPDAVAGPPNIVVTDIDGKQHTIPNPLALYQFDASVVAQDFPNDPFNTWLTTKRYPSDSSPSAQSQNSQLNSAINSQVRNLRSMVRFIMSAIPTFGPFSNDEWIPGQPGAYASLEDIHDNIHGLVGGPGPSDQSAPQGHMSIVPYAAFDPIFWLHHCNVDRLFAIWQAIHPDSYVQPEPSTSGTFTRNAGETEDVSSSLTPFWRDPSTFYTSTDARTTGAFGYAYPETQSWNFSSPSAYQQSVKAAINQLYGSTVRRPRGSQTQSFMAAPATISDQLASVPIISRDISSASATHADSPKGATTSHDKAVGGSETKAQVPIMQSMKKAFEAHNPFSHNQPGTSHKTTAKEPVPEDKKDIQIHNPGKGYDEPHKNIALEGGYKEWITNIRVPKHVLGGTFQVHVFLGDVPNDINRWLVHDHNVGTFTALGSNPLTTSCEKCKRDAGRDLHVTGIIPLTEALTDAIERRDLRSLDKDDVVSYLKDNLHWRVTQANGSEKSRDEVPGLQISVVSTDVTIPDEPYELPIYSGHYTIHPECTEGKPCGYRAGDAY